MHRFVLSRAALALAALALAAPAFAQSNSSPPGGAAAGVASVATSCPTVGAATGAVTLSGYVGGRSVSATTDTILTTDCGALVVYTGSAAVAVALPTPTGASGSFPTGFVVTLKNNATSAVSVTPTSSTIDGSASALAIAAGTSRTFATVDGSTWTSFPGASTGGGGTPGGSSGQVQYNNAGAFGGLPISGSGGTVVATTSATRNAGDCTAWDASGNSIGTGAPCNGPPRIAGLYYPLWRQPGGSVQGNTFNQNAIFCAPWWQARSETWDTMTFRVWATSSGKSALFAVYANGVGSTGVNQPMGAPLLKMTTGQDLGSDITWSFASNSSASAAFQMTTGIKWLCAIHNETTMTARYNTYPPFEVSNLIGAIYANQVPINGAGTGVDSLYLSSQTYGTWPTVTTATSWTASLDANGTMPQAIVHVTSVP